MILQANGNNFTIPGKNVKVTIENNLDRIELSGMTSGSDSVNAGTKPKKINVSLTIPKSKKDDLRELSKTAEALEDNGDPVVYMISDEQANARNIREVIFSGTFRSAEAGNIRGWDISFSLQEYRSTAEKKEAREKYKETSVTDSEGKTIHADSKNDSAIKQAMNSAEKAIKA